MEQTPSSPGRSPELPSVSPPSSGETLSSDQAPETLNESAQEKQESRGEAAPVDSQIPALPVSSVPTVQAPVADDTTQPLAVLPTIANDDDLIEKEWVDRAKKVLAETKDDPYRREQEVSRLQTDYLLKRYGRDLGSKR